MPTGRPHLCNEDLESHERHMFRKPQLVWKRQGKLLNYITAFAHCGSLQETCISDTLVIFIQFPYFDIYIYIYHEKVTGSYTVANTVLQINLYIRPLTVRIVTNTKYLGIPLRFARNIATFFYQVKMTSPWERIQCLSGWTHNGSWSPAFKIAFAPP